MQSELVGDLLHGHRLEILDAFRKKIVLGCDEDIRYAVALGYLALIMETERYNRYVPGDEGWERNTVDSAQKFEQALKILE